MEESRSTSGQILLITLLVLALATTVALALISRTTTDVNVSTQVEESSRAFSAAEAGIEESLKLGLAATSTTLSSGAHYDVSATVIGQTSGFEFPKVIPRGDVATLWLTSHTGQDVDIPPGGNYNSATLNLCWVRAGAAEPALEAAFYFIDRSDGGTYKVSRVALNTEAVADGDNFTSSGIGGGCGGLPHGGTTPNSRSYTVTLSNLGIDPGLLGTDDGLLMVRLRPLYADAWIGASSSVTLPKQGNVFNSCGKTGAGVVRCITAYQLYRTPLSIFDYALYSQGSSL